MEELSVVVVGGGAGLGALTVRRAVEAGAAAVGVLDLDGDAAGDTARAAGERGVPVAHAQCDVGDGAATRRAMDRVVAELGHLDTVVNCAAVYPRRPLLEISEEDWDTSLAVNVKGTYHVMVAAVRHMQAGERTDGVRGRIVNISSVDAFKAHPQNAHYAATKAAVVSLTRSFAHELAPEGILVNAIAPAGMATDQARASDFLDELAGANPLGRAAAPQEIAEWVLMAGGPRNTYMTGETIIVSGGYLYA